MGYIPLYKEHKRGNEMAKYAKIQKNIDGKEKYSITPQIPGGYITPEKYKNKLDSLKQGNVFTDAIIESFKVGAIKKWKKELSNRIIDDAMDSIRSYSKLHEKENRDALDEVMWNSIADIKFNVMKDTLTKKSLFTQIKEALEVKDYARASNLQLELKANMEEIQQLYVRYKKNIY